MKSIFPASYSTLFPEALAILLSDKYATGSVTCRFLVRGVGDTYLITTTDNRYILRVYRTTHRNLPQIQEEVKVLLALKQAGVSVSWPVTDKAGEAIQIINAAEGERYAVLFSYAPGNNARELSEQQLRLFGREMARVHNITATLPNDGNRWTFDNETTLLRPLQVLAPVFKEDPEGYAWLKEAVNQTADYLSQLPADRFTKGYCHYDFLPKNFHFDGDKITFFDFDFMGYGWLVNDIASFWQHLTIEVYTGRLTRATADESWLIFLAAYREQRPIDEQELVAIPYLALGFWLFYMSFHTTHDQFYSFTQPAQLKVYTRFLQFMTAGCYKSVE